MRPPAAIPLILAAAAAARDTFHESLTLHPLPDGKLSVLFEFTTHFSLHGDAQHSHHSLTPPGLLLPLERNNVSEITVSFSSGQWHARRHGEAGPLSYEAGGGGGTVRGWLRGENEEATDAAWDAVTHAFGGMFCAGVVGAEDSGEAVRTFGELYPPARDGENASHYLVSTPHLHLCTENLTPFLSLLPSKGVSGLSALLAKPGVVLAWGFKTEGIDVVMPAADEPGSWTGWWEGVVDLVPKQGGRDFSISKLFQQPMPRVFPAATSSTLRVIRPNDERFRAEPAPQRTLGRWVDGTRRTVEEWDAATLGGADVQFWWDGEGEFQHPLEFTPPAVTVNRVAADKYASDATLVVEIANYADFDRPAVYSEVWPWWVKGWMSEMSVSVDGTARPDILHDVEYFPSVPPTPSTTSLHLHLTLPARSTVRLSIPFTKLTLKYDDHRPDAERGREIPSSILTLLDVEGEDSDDHETGAAETDPRKSSRRRVYAPKLLLDVPTPDFSMPYNVIIMTSTVMAVFFGSIQGRLVRRWGWVETEEELEVPEEAETINGEKQKSQANEKVEKSQFEDDFDDLNANDTDSDADETLAEIKARHK